MPEQVAHEHQARHIRWPKGGGYEAGEASLTANGNWFWARAHPGGFPEAVRLETCPGCGLALWGLPGRPQGWKAGVDAEVLA